MKKRYIVAAILVILFFLMCLLADQCFLEPALLCPVAWGEEPALASEKWNTLVERAAQHGISAENLKGISDVLSLVESEDFPAEPFLDKALEGMAKQVPVDTIAEVLRTRLGYCTTCRTVLDSMQGIQQEPVEQRKQAIIILSESMAQGISRKELEELASHTPRPRSVHLANASQDLATLRVLDFSPDDALEIVRTGLEQGMYHQRNREIPGIVRWGRKEGLSNEELKDIFLSHIRRRRGMKGILHERQHIRQQFRGSGPGTGGPRSRPRH